MIAYILNEAFCFERLFEVKTHLDLKSYIHIIAKEARSSAFVPPHKVSDSS